MPQSLTSPWVGKITAANARYNKWATQYKCEVLEQYYRGFQWDISKQENAAPYTLNMIYSTVKIKLANYLVRNPRVIITPKPGDANFDLEKAIASAQIKESLINTILTDQNSEFAFVLKKAARDSFTRFGVVEVGYSASFIENPNLDKPEYASDRNPEVNKDRVVTEPRETLESERIYFKYINPKRFRVGANNEADTLKSCDWVGYYEFVHIKDLAKALKKKVEDFRTELGAAAVSPEDPTTDTDPTLEEAEDLIKIWHIWDNRARKRYILTDSDGEIRFSKDFERLPIFDLRWDLDFEGFYPIPPVFQWLSPQDEINEAREQARNHRRRFTRKFQIKENSISAEEMDKFTHGPDGTVIFYKHSGIEPIASPDLGKASDQALVVPKDDFNLVSATSQEARGIGDRVTATQANIIEGRASIREGAEVEEVNSWLAYIVREAILTARDRFTQPMYAETPQGNKSQMLMDYTANRSYNQIWPDQLDDGYDFVVLIDVASTSPNQNELEKTKFLEFLAVLQNFPQLSLSPLLIREAAYKIGYRNERVIREMQNAALLQMIGQAAQAGALGGGDPSGAMAPSGGQAQRMIEQQTPPTTNEIQSQLDNQLVQ